MGGTPTRRPEEWKIETFVRFDDPKSQLCGSVPGRLDYPTGRSHLRRRQNDSLAAPDGKDLTKPLEYLCTRDSIDGEDEGLCKEESFRSQRQDPYKLLGALRKKVCSKQDDASCVAEELCLKEESQDNARGHRIGKVYTSFVADDPCLKGERQKNARDAHNGEKYTTDLYGHHNRNSLTGHFFGKAERINAYRESLSRSTKNRDPLSWTPFNALRKTLMDARGSALSTSQTLSESRSSVHGSNADCPTQISHSRSGSLSSSRCVTPRRLGRHYSHTIPSRRDSLTHRPSRIDGPIPKEGLRSVPKCAEILYQDCPLSDSKSPRRCIRFVPNTVVATPRRSSNGIKAPSTRRITLIERYQRGLSLRKATLSSKSSSSSSKVSSCSLAGRTLSASAGKDPHFMCSEGYWRELSEEGLSPLRSPWREDQKGSHHEDPRRSQPCRTQLPPKNLRRNNRQPEIHDTDMRRRSAHCCGPAPHTLNESFGYDDPSYYNSYPPSDFSNSSQLTRGQTVNYSSPQRTRTPYLSTDGPQAWRSRPSYKNDDAAREPSLYDDSPQTKDSFTCTRPFSAPNGLSSANDHDPHAGRDFSWEENPRPAKDSFRCTRPRLATKDSSSANDDPHPPRNFSLQNDYPQPTKDSVRCTRSRLSAKDMPSANYGPKAARHLAYQNESQESKELSDQFDDPLNARPSWRPNDLYEARTEAREVFHPFSGREIFDPVEDPISTTNSCWYDDHGRANEERKITQDSSWRILAPDTELDVESSSCKESHRNSRRSVSGREKASKFDHQSVSWRQTTDPHMASRQGTSVCKESNFQRNPSRNFECDEVRKLPAYNAHPHVKPRANLRHDNIAPIKLPCCRSQESTSVSSRHYSQPQWHEPFQTRESNNISMQSEAL